MLTTQTWHTFTLVQVKTEKMPSFEELVRLLHPTPALGIAPRDQFPLLKEWREGATHLGAPFGLRVNAQNFLCLVSIRNLRWDSEFYYVENGCGIVEESHLDDEWRELKFKRESVKKVFKI